MTPGAALCPECHTPVPVPATLRYLRGRNAVMAFDFKPLRDHMADHQPQFTTSLPSTAADSPPDGDPAIQEDPSLCGWGDCQKRATTALRFRGQPGHVHNCDPHAAINREWSDVIESAPMPNCPFPHGGMWIDTPADLA